MIGFVESRGLRRPGMFLERQLSSMRLPHLVWLLSGCLVVLGCGSSDSDSSGADAAVSDASDTDASGSTGHPTPSNTGVPPGTTLTDYAGPCTITTPDTVITEKLIDCDGQPLDIQTTGVLVERSKVIGGISVGERDTDPEGDDPIRVTVIDSELVGNDSFRPIGVSHYRVVGSYLHGSYSGGECHNACTIERSFVTGLSSHASGLRVLRNATIKGSTIWCEPWPESDDDDNGEPDLDGGCSADLVMYEEFGLPQNVHLEGNLFKATWAYFCVRQDGENGGGLVFVDNVFEKGEFGACGRAAPATDFESEGNTFTGNRYDDGTPIESWD